MTKQPLLTDLINEYRLKLTTVQEVAKTSDENESVLTAQAVESFIKEFIKKLELIQAETLLTYLPDMLAEYAKKHSIAGFYVSVFIDGSGIASCPSNFIAEFEFESIPELIEKLNQ